MRDPYEILDISPDATEADIKRAFREKAKQYHPDRHPGNERVAEVFKEINAAYQLLNSKNRARTDFDRRRRAAAQETPKPQGNAQTRSGHERAAGMAGEQFHEYYEQASKRAEQKSSHADSDSSDNADADADDLYRDNFADHQFAEQEQRASQADNLYGGDSGQWFRKEQKADEDKKSSGGRSFSDFLSKVTDRGKGIFGSRDKVEPDISAQLNGRRRDGRGVDVQYSLTIPFLDAVRGSRHRLTIPMETGSGKTLDITIPAGVRDGQQIRLKGQGTQGTPPGDALIDIVVEDHDYYMRDGLDLFIDIPVTLDEAMLGADIRVPTIHGPVTVKIPPGSDSGQTLRLRGKGIIRAEKGGKQIAGDQYLTLSVKMPPAPGPLLRRAVEEEARNSPYGVRQGLKDLM